MNTKLERIQFVDEVRHLITGDKFKGVQVNPYEFTIKTNNNGITLTLRGEADHHNVFTVFMKIEKPSDKIGNRYTGKHNFHTSQHLEDALPEFEYFLKETINKLN